MAARCSLLYNIARMKWNLASHRNLLLGACAKSVFHFCCRVESQKGGRLIVCHRSQYLCSQPLLDAGGEAAVYPTVHT
jgi:hypothetical protein